MPQGSKLHFQFSYKGTVSHHKHDLGILNFYFKLPEAGTICPPAYQEPLHPSVKDLQQVMKYWS